MTTRNSAVAQVIAASAASEVSPGLAIEILAKEPPLLSTTEKLTERTDLPVAGLPRPEPRHLPLWARLRLLWHRQIVRDAQ